jgi:hypothetical protein
VVVLTKKGSDEQKPQKRRSVMKNLKQLFDLLTVLMLATFIFSGCATQTAIPKANEVSNLKGRTSQQILDSLGPPDKKYVINEGEMWQYRRASDSHRGSNLVTAISTWGMASGSNSLFADLLLLTITNDVVTEYSLQTYDGQTSASSKTAKTPVPAATTPPAEPAVKEVVKKKTTKK